MSKRVSLIAAVMLVISAFLPRPVEAQEELAVPQSAPAVPAGTLQEESAEVPAEEGPPPVEEAPPEAAPEGGESPGAAVPEETPGREASPEEAPAARVYLFAGTIQSIGPRRLSILGTSPAGTELTLEFNLDEDTQVAEGLKVGDQVVVHFQVTEEGMYRATSVRYPGDGLPDNVLPPELAGKAGPTEATPPAEAPPRVVNIEVEGNERVPTDEILQVVSTRIGDPVLKPRLRRDMQAIFDMGYFTDVRLDTRYAPGGVRLVFRVLENPVVEHLQITGNQVVPTEKILELIETREGQILNTRTLHADIQAINKYYDEELGYLLRPTHVVNLHWDEAAGTLNLEIQDGVVVKSIEVKGVTVFPLEKVEEQIHTQVGQLFNQKKLREDNARIAELYEKNDYILDTIVPSLDPESGRVTLNVVEAVVEKIQVRGNTKTQTETVLRNVRTKPGEVLRRKKLQRDLERLNNLGYFKKVDIQPEPGSEPGKVVLVLEVEEQKTGLATIGVGYAGGGSGAVRPGITGAISFSDRNLFGEGKSASVQLQRGANIQTYGLSYFDPAIDEAQNSIGFTLFFNQVDALRQPVLNRPGDFALFQDRRFGGTFTFGHPWTDDFRTFITLRRESLEFLRDPASDFAPVGLGRGDLNSVALSALYDTRDDVFNPHVGQFANVAVAVAGLGGDFNYQKFTGEIRHYVPLTERQTIALRLMGGTLSSGAPLSEFFFAGGTDTLRGYQANSFFGTRMIVANAEYRFPIANIKMLNGAVFVDAGNAWIPGVTDSKLFTDAGIGLRIVFPTLGLGVIRIDYAFGERGSRSTIGIGQTF